MCDYSLMAVPNRLAVEDEELVAHRFPTGSMGLASPADVRRHAVSQRTESQGFWAAVQRFFNPPNTGPVCAVCIPPGARLRLRDIPESVQRDYEVSGNEEVAFTQISAAANTYRDAVRFGNGRQLRLQQLREGQRVRVLDLSGADFSIEPVREEQFLLRAR
jgi:hypothetical protein